MIKTKQNKKQTIPPLTKLNTLVSVIHAQKNKTCKSSPVSDTHLLSLLSAGSNIISFHAQLNPSPKTHSKPVLFSSLTERHRLFKFKANKLATAGQPSFPKIKAGGKVLFFPLLSPRCLQVKGTSTNTQLHRLTNGGWSQEQVQSSL